MKALKQRLSRLSNYCWVLVASQLKRIPGIEKKLPEPGQAFVQAWTDEMIGTYIKSFGRVLYADQPCSIRHPETYKPAAEVEDRYRLSEAQIRQFYEDGFMGPFTLCSQEEMYALREEVWQEINQPSEIYGFQTWRDRHLDCAGVLDIVRRPIVRETLAQFLGPNLFLWRSQMHIKQPNSPGFTWHQASTYMMESLYKPALFPKDRDKLFELSCWVAFDDVTIENGCMQFIPGSHDKMRTMSIAGKGIEDFSDAKFRLHAEIDPDKVVKMELKAGQFLIFSERVIHGSKANLSNNRRWGMAFRAVQPDVQVYDDVPWHYVEYLQQTFSLKKWGGLLLRGDDTAKVNRIYPEEQLKVKQALSIKRS